MDSDKIAYLNYQSDLPNYDDPEVNHWRLISTITFLKETNPITEDWMEIHKGHIKKYIEFIPEFNLKQHMSDRGYIQKVNELHTIANYMDNTLRTKGTFETKWYLKMLEKFKEIYDMIIEMDDLENLMNGMGVK